ncbi:hypothetical protein Pan97_12360 [Bremerella volcania]|uniref:Uncharacterized protein n=1 Tax=Bremerella volcania TaxID=2527984 RepID=A0A518C4T9_9BACT|nr:hypothetical protein Pan97_12360 [Bremerella volcania]
MRLATDTPLGHFQEWLNATRSSLEGPGFNLQQS